MHGDTDYPPLVTQTAHRVVTHLPRGVEWADVYAAGALGLVMAGRRFDPAKGVRFATFASAAVAGEILRLIEREGRHAGVVPLDDLAGDNCDDLAGLLDRAALSRELARLPDRERQVVSLRFADGLPVATVAAVMGVSAARVSQIQARALCRLRAWLSAPE